MFYACGKNWYVINAPDVEETERKNDYKIERVQYFSSSLGLLWTEFEQFVSVILHEKLLNGLGKVRIEIRLQCF